MRRSLQIARTRPLLTSFGVLPPQFGRIDSLRLFELRPTLRYHQVIHRRLFAPKSALPLCTVRPTSPAALRGALSASSASPVSASRQDLPGQPSPLRHRVRHSTSPDLPQSDLHVAARAGSEAHTPTEIWQRWEGRSNEILPMSAQFVPAHSLHCAAESRRPRIWASPAMTRVELATRHWIAQQSKE